MAPERSSTSSTSSGRAAEPQASAPTPEDATVPTAPRFAPRSPSAARAVRGPGRDPRPGGLLQSAAPGLTTAGGQMAARSQTPNARKRLLELDASAGLFDLGLQLRGLFLLDALLDGLRGLVDE